MTTAFITGASGFIGTALTRRLVADGIEVIALVRSARSAQRVQDLGARPVLGDLTDPTPWADALRGADVVFHLAAETDVSAPAHQHERVTVSGTRAVVEAARRARVPKFVHCGSEAALLAGQPLIEVDETAPLRPDSSGAYSAAKARAEQIVLEASADGFETVSIRPRFVWGPDSPLIDGLVEMARLGEFAWVDGGRHCTDVTYVDNAVQGLVLGWQRGRNGQAYFITDEHRVEFRAFLERLFAAYGFDGPVAEIDATGAAKSALAPFVWFIGQDCLLRTDKADRELEYSPIVSQEAGVDRTRERVERSRV